MAMWSPWRGCRKVSEGCLHCYIHKSDAKRGIDTSCILKTDNFTAPIARKKNGDYKIKPGSMVYVCFSTDFLIEDADKWRDECWQMMRERSDLHFLFLTKRIERLLKCKPSDWGNGYNNVTVGCTIENQNNADRRLSIFDKLPIKHKNIIAQPLLEPINIEKYLKGIELVLIGGEQDKDARALDLAWVQDLKQQCIRHGVPFSFRQTGTHFIVDGKITRTSVKELQQKELI